MIKDGGRMRPPRERNSTRQQESSQPARLLGIEEGAAQGEEGSPHTKPSPERNACCVLLVATSSFIPTTPV
jgi:hypothetical protein